MDVKSLCVFWLLLLLLLKEGLDSSVVAHLQLLQREWVQIPFKPFFLLYHYI